jgi:hypothetical protein
MEKSLYFLHLKMYDGVFIDQIPVQFHSKLLTYFVSYLGVQLK